MEGRGSYPGCVIWCLTESPSSAVRTPALRWRSPIWKSTMRRCTISWTLKGNSWFQWGPVYNIIYVYRCMVEGYVDYVCSLRNHILPCSWESNTFVLLRRLTYSMFPQNTVSVDLAVWKTKNWCKLKGYPFICSNLLKYPQCRFLVIFTAK